MKRYDLGEVINSDGGIKIDVKGGFETLRSSIYNEFNEPGCKILGILADANDSIDGRWKSISDKLGEANCQVPNEIGRFGSIFQGPRDIKVGVWLMPNNQESGELEDFVYKMIPKDDPVLPKAKDFIDSIPQKDRKFSKIKRAYVHAWLATRKKPRPLGTAIDAQDLNADVEIAEFFVSWLKDLFGI